MNAPVQPSLAVPIADATPALRRSRQARVVWGSHVVTVGADAPVRVQSMTNTDTEDAIATAIQVKELAIAGSEMVRITVNTPEAAQQVPYIREQLDRMGIDVPLIGDFHYNGHRLLTDYPACAEALSKYRINPGNVGKGDKHDRQFGQMIEAAMRWSKPVRIGVNWGSLDQELLASLMDINSARAEPWDAKLVMYEALVTSAIDSARLAESMGMDGSQIVLSCKVSGVQDLISVYRELARRCDYPLHLGLTEAGMGTKGTVLVADVRAEIVQAANAGQFTQVDNLVYFTASDPLHGQELWVSDGTVSGTNLIKDIYPGSLSSAQSFEPSSICAVGSKLFFSATSDVAGTELWVTDGSASGTYMVKDIANNLREKISDNEFEVLGPAPCLVERIRGKFRYHLIVKLFSPDANAFGNLVEYLRAKTIGTSDKNVHIAIDVDAIDLI